MYGQFMFNIWHILCLVQAGQNIIIRNSQQASGQSADLPSTSQIVQGVNAAIRSQHPFFITQVCKSLSVEFSEKIENLKKL